MGDLVQGDVGGVEWGGTGFVVDVVGVRGADPQPARPPWSSCGALLTSTRSLTVTQDYAPARWVVQLTSSPVVFVIRAAISLLE